MISKRLIVIFFVLLNNVLFPRAGGGSSGGSGGSGGGGFGYGGYGGRLVMSETERIIANVTIIVLVALFSSFLSILLYRFYQKGKQNHKLLKERYPTDNFWDADKIVSYSKNYFVNMQKCWSNNDLTPIKDTMSLSCFNFLQRFLLRYKKNGLKNIVDKISINRVEIIGFKDFIQDSNDQISVLIEGEMVDYIYPVKIEEKLSKFRDIYVFKREGDELKLIEIINDPHFFDIGLEKNYIEL